MVSFEHFTVSPLSYYFVPCAAVQGFSVQVIDRVDDIIPVGRTAVQSSEPLISCFAAHSHCAHRSGGGFKKAFRIRRGIGRSHRRKLTACSGNAAHHRLSVINAVRCFTVGDNIYCASNGYDRASSCGKVFHKLAYALQIFFGNNVGGICVNALCCTASRCKSLYLGNISPYDRKFYLVQKL